MTSWGTWSWTVAGMAIGIVIGVAAVTAVGVLLLEAKRRRDQRATAFQDRLAEPISRELGHAGVSVLPTVRIPLWSSATRPALIQLIGQVPSHDLRDRVVRIVEREATRLHYFRIEDRLRVTPTTEDRGRHSA